MDVFLKKVISVSGRLQRLARSLGMKGLTHLNRYKMMVYETTHHGPPDTIVVKNKYGWIDKLKKNVRKNVNVEVNPEDLDIKSKDETQL